MGYRSSAVIPFATVTARGSLAREFNLDSNIETIAGPCDRTYRNALQVPYSICLSLFAVGAPRFELGDLIDPNDAE